MIHDDRITELLAAALPYRSLEDDDPQKAPLTGIVDEINRLRAIQARVLNETPERVEPAVPERDLEAPLPDLSKTPLPRRSKALA